MFSPTDSSPASSIIPAGSGYHLHRNLKVKPLVEVSEDEPAPEPSFESPGTEPLIG